MERLMRSTQTDFYCGPTILVGCNGMGTYPNWLRTSLSLTMNFSQYDFLQNIFRFGVHNVHFK